MSSAPPGIRKRITRSGESHWQVRFLVRDSAAKGGWVETSKTFPSLASAKAFKAERDRESALGLRRFDPRAGRATLAAVWDQFAALKQPAVSAKTWSGYRQSWNLRIRPTFGSTPVQEISRESISTWLSKLTVGPWAKVGTLRLLRSILDFAVADFRIHTNPAAAIKPPRIPPRERHRYLDVEEVASLVAALGDQGDVALILAYTGLRWSELVALRVSDVDLAARRLHVRRAAPEVEGRIVIGPPKTKAGVRSVPLPKVVIDALTARIMGRPGDQPAITSCDATMLRASNWRRQTGWNEAINRLELAPLTIHELRHTYASLARSAGADLRYVQKTMGHSSPTVTANIYADIYDHELDTVADRLDMLTNRHQPIPQARTAAIMRPETRRRWWWPSTEAGSHFPATDSGLCIDVADEGSITAPDWKRSTRVRQKAAGGAGTK